MGIAKDYYRLLEEESKGFYRETDDAHKKSLFQKALKGSTKRLTNAGVNPALATIGTLMGSMLGGKEIAKHHLGTDLAKNLGAPGMGNFLDAAALTPFLLSKTSKVGHSLKSQKQESNYFVGGNNWEDYGAKQQATHAFRALTKVANTGSALGVGAGLLSGHAGLSLAATHLNPMIALSHAGNAAGGAIGHVGSAALNGVGSLVGGGAGSALHHSASLLDTVAPGLGTMMGMMVPAMMNNLTPKNKRNIVAVKPLNEPGVSQLMMSSTYRSYSNSILILQSQGLLKPSEGLMLGILNDINLNTHALIPMYGKFLSNAKEVSQEHHINSLGGLFDDDTGILTGNREKKAGLDKGTFDLRRAFFKTMQGLELFGEGLLYKIPFASKLTGMTKKEFEEKKKNILYTNDHKQRATEAAHLKTGVNLSTIRLLTTKADKFLNAPDFESRMVGLTSGIYEFTRFMALQTEKGKAASDEYNKVFNSLEDRLEKIIGKEEDKKNKRYHSIKSWAKDKLINFLKKTNPVYMLMESGKQLGKDIYKTFNLRQRFKDHLGISSDKEIKDTYEKNKKSISHNFDLKKSYETYLGKYLPDHMTQIVFYLKNISINTKDLLKAKGIEDSAAGLSIDKKWRGHFGEYMDDNSFSKKMKVAALKLTRNQLGIRHRNIFGVSGFLLKTLGLKKAMKADSTYMNDLFTSDILSGESSERTGGGAGRSGAGTGTAEASQEKIVAKRTHTKIVRSLLKTPTILEKMFEWFKKNPLCCDCCDCCDYGESSKLKHKKAEGSIGFSGVFDLFKGKRMKKGLNALKWVLKKLGKRVLLPIALFGLDMAKHIPGLSTIVEKVTDLSKNLWGKIEHVFTGLKKALIDAAEYAGKFLRKIPGLSKLLGTGTKIEATKLLENKATKKDIKAKDIVKEKTKVNFKELNNNEVKTKLKSELANKLVNDNDKERKVLSKFSTEIKKVSKLKAAKPGPTGVTILKNIIHNKLEKFIIKIAGKEMAEKFMIAAGTTLAGFAAGGLPGILMTLLDLAMWGDLVWDIYCFIKDEYTKEVRALYKSGNLFKNSATMNSILTTSEKFIDAVQYNKAAKPLFNHNYIEGNTVDLDSGHLYNFFKQKSGNFNVLSNVYSKASKYDRLENDDDIWAYQWLSHLSPDKRKEIINKIKHHKLSKEEFTKMMKSGIYNLRHPEGMLPGDIATVGRNGNILLYNPDHPGTPRTGSVNINNLVNNYKKSNKYKNPNNYFGTNKVNLTSMIGNGKSTDLNNIPTIIYNKDGSVTKEYPDGKTITTYPKKKEVDQITKQQMAISGKIAEGLLNLSKSLEAIGIGIHTLVNIENQNQQILKTIKIPEIKN